MRFLLKIKTFYFIELINTSERERAAHSRLNSGLWTKKTTDGQTNFPNLMAKNWNLDIFGLQFCVHFMNR